MPTNTDDDYNFAGRVMFGGTVGLPANSVGDLQINPSAPLHVTKTQKRYLIVHSQPHGVPAVSERRVRHRSFAAGLMLAIYAGVVVPSTGDATITVDLLRNGVTILTAPIVLGSTVAAYNSVAGALIASPVFVSGAVFETVITVSAGTGVLGQGVYVSVNLSEGA